MNQSDQRKLNAIALFVAISGLLTISSILFALVHFRHIQLASADAHLTLLAGLSLIYLATLLNRGKHTAWLVALPVYSFLVLRNLRHFIFDFPGEDHLHIAAILSLALPIVTLLALIYYRRLFDVRSEVRNFTTAVQRSAVILLVAFAYGVAGFMLLDEHDFHQEITPVAAAHYTVDQFGLTTTTPVSAYTKRAHIFVDSLAAISFGAVFYTAVSLFSPIRFRLSRHRQDYEDIRRLIEHYSTTSEDFFMLWPPDKSYFFNAARSAAVAYKAAGGVALIIGDPTGPKAQIKPLLQDFSRFCRLNDWQPALIHTEDKYLELYQELGFEAQKIGEEAIINTKNFMDKVATTKDFRHIANKFANLGYSCNLIEPPYTEELLTRLQVISDDWLSRPGRAERSFMLGFFSYDYIQLCTLMVAEDSHGTIQAFINLVPSSIPTESNFDFLRHATGSPGNINDYLLLNFIQELDRQKIPWLNMGLSALAGLEDAESPSKSLNRFLNFAYNNADRFFSFQGLNRFKSKYQPEWQDRYIVYRGGLRGFSKTVNALMRAMRH